MAEKDIRSGDDMVVGDTMRTDQSWMRDIPTDDLVPETTGLKTKIPLETAEGVQLVGPDGNPRGIRTELLRTDDEVSKAWKIKQSREPCWMCRHFKFRVFTREQKLQFIRNLIRDHGWKPEHIKGEIGNIELFEYCPVHQLLTHRNASCLKYWVRRDDL